MKKIIVILLVGTQFLNIFAMGFDYYGDPEWLPESPQLANEPTVNDPAPLHENTPVVHTPCIQSFQNLNQTAPISAQDAKEKAAYLCAIVRAFNPTQGQKECPAFHAFADLQNENGAQETTHSKHFKCYECGKAFTRKGNLIKHKRISHSSAKHFSFDESASKQPHGIAAAAQDQVSTSGTEDPNHPSAGNYFVPASTVDSLTVEIPSALREALTQSFAGKARGTRPVEIAVKLTAMAYSIMYPKADPQELERLIKDGQPLPQPINSVKEYRTFADPLPETQGISEETHMMVPHVISQQIPQQTDQPTAVPRTETVTVLASGSIAPSDDPSHINPLPANGAHNLKEQQPKDFSSWATYKCPYCPKIFKHTENRSRHIIGTHTMKKKVACLVPGCGYKCSRADAMKRHKDSVHGDPTAGKKFYCLVLNCGFYCTSQHSLTSHTNTKHLSTPL